MSRRALKASARSAMVLAAGRTAVAVVTLLVVGSSAWAQSDAAETWQEVTAVPPATFRLDRLQRLDVSVGSALTYGIDPDTLSVDTDGVVRYVLVVKSSSGALNVLYEGIHCKKATLKTYARWDNSAAWNVSSHAAWRPLDFSGSTRHAMRMAREGVCDGPTPNGSAAQILRTLQTGRGDTR